MHQYSSLIADVNSRCPPRLDTDTADTVHPLITWHGRCETNVAVARAAYCCIGVCGPMRVLLRMIAGMQSSRELAR